MTLFTNFGRHFVFVARRFFFRLKLPAFWIYIVIRPEANGKFGAKHKLRSKPTMLCVAVVHSFIHSGRFLHCGANASFPYGAIEFVEIFCPRFFCSVCGMEFVCGDRRLLTIQHLPPFTYVFFDCFSCWTHFNEIILYFFFVSKFSRSTHECTTTT